MESETLVRHILDMEGEAKADQAPTPLHPPAQSPDVFPAVSHFLGMFLKRAPVQNKLLGRAPDLEKSLVFLQALLERWAIDIHVLAVLQDVLGAVFVQAFSSKLVRNMTQQAHR